MCGLVGIIGENVSVNHFESIFHQGLLADSVRGMHSTGVITAGNNKSNWYKRGVDGAQFVQDGEYVKWMRKQTTMKALMGHNRYATLGNAYSTENAHPFEEGDIILQHNGTLKFWKTHKEAKGFVVDSNYIAHMINLQGIDATVKILEGAWALAYHNADDNTINFCRNAERPLWFARLRRGTGKKETLNTWVYGSEKGMLKWIVERNGYEVINFFQLREEKLMTFDLSSDMSTFTVRDLEYTAYNKPKSYHTTYGEWYKPGAPAQSKAGNRVIPFHPQATELVDGVKAGDRVAFFPTHFKMLSTNYSKTHGQLFGYRCDGGFEAVRLNYVDSRLLEGLEWNEQMDAYQVRQGEYSSVAIADMIMDGTEFLVLDSHQMAVDNWIGNSSDLPAVVGIRGLPTDQKEQVLDWPEDEDGIVEDHNLLPNTGNFPGPGGILISEKAWRDITACGCYECMGVVWPSEASELEWLNYETFLCGECSTDSVDEVKSA